MKKKKWTKKKKIIFLIIAILAIVFVIFKIASPKEIEEEKIEFEAIEKRDIAQSISATGVITTNDTKNIVGKLSGSKIKTVNVKEGDKIAVGDVICTFDTSDAQYNLAVAQDTKNLSVAQSNIGTQGAQRNLDDAIKNKNETLEGLKQTMDGAKANLKNAQTNLQASEATLKATSDKLTTELKALESQRDLIQSQIDATQNVVAPGGNVSGITNNQVDSGLTSGGTTSNLEEQLEQIDTNIKSKKKEIETNNSNLTSLQSSVAEWQQRYDSAVKTYNSTKDALNKNVDTLQDQVTSSQISTNITDNSAKTQIKSLQDQISEGIIKSTVNGTVTSVGVKAGDIYTGSTIAVVEGCEDFIIEAEIDEYDIPDVRVGMKVLIKTDATREEELEGEVTYVASSASTSQSSSLSQLSTTATGSGAATYTVKIELQTPNDRLRLGMNAKLSIITDSREQVWSVPYEAVYDREDGTSYIEILKNEETEEKQEIDVKRGLEGTYYVEIKSDELKDGMNVVLPKIEAGDSLENLLQAMGADAGI